MWPLVDRVKNLIEKKWPGLSDSGMTSGGLIKFQNFCRKHFLVTLYISISYSHPFERNLYFLNPVVSPAGGSHGTLCKNRCLLHAGDKHMFGHNKENWCGS